MNTIDLAEISTWLASAIEYARTTTLAEEWEDTHGLAWGDWEATYDTDLAD